MFIIFSGLARKVTNSQEQDLRVTLEQNRAKSLADLNSRKSKGKKQKGEKKTILSQEESLKIIQKNDELERTQFLADVVKNYTIKKGVIPQKTVQSLDPINLRKRPPAPGNREFFGDFNSEIATTLNGHSQNLSKSWDKRGPYKKQNSFNQKNSDESMNFRQRKRRSAEEDASGSDSDAKKTRPTGSYEGLPKSWNNRGSYNKQQSFDQNNKDESLNFRQHIRSADDCSSGNESEAMKTRHNKPNGKRPIKQLYCNTQKRLGKCEFSFCKFKHLTYKQLEQVLLKTLKAYS